MLPRYVGMTREHRPRGFFIKRKSKRRGVTARKFKYIEKRSVSSP